MNSETTLYVPVTAKPRKSAKITYVRAKTKAFKALAKQRTAELVAASTGWNDTIVEADYSREGSMYQ